MFPGFSDTMSSSVLGQWRAGRPPSLQCSGYSVDQNDLHSRERGTSPFDSITTVNIHSKHLGKCYMWDEADYRGCLMKNSVQIVALMTSKSCIRFPWKTKMYTFNSKLVTFNAIVNCIIQNHNYIIWEFIVHKGPGLSQDIIPFFLCFSKIICLEE